MPYDAILTNVHIAANGAGTDHAVRLDRHVVTDVHLNVLDLAMLLHPCWPHNNILLDDNVGPEIDWSHITTHHDLGVHDVFTLHANVLEALQDHMFADFVLLLREQVELRLVVLGHRLHVDFLRSLTMKINY